MSHHARLYITPTPSAVVSDIELHESATSEIVTQTVDTLTIDDVRRIIQLAYQTPGAKSYRLILIVARQIAIEAQHAFLKILEEPPATTRFAIVLPSTAGLLPTVLSRLALIASVSGGEVNSLFRQFVGLRPKERLDLIADIVKRKADQDYATLYDGLVAYMAADAVASEYLRLVQTLLLQLRQKGASKKMVWEELALTLPTAQLQEPI